MFYKKENDYLLEASNFVLFPDGLMLTVENKNSYEYPVNGWYWFDTEEEAKEFFKME